MITKRKNPKFVGIPPIQVRNESLLIFDCDTKHNGGFRMFWAMGVVYRIMHFDDCDVVYVNCGFFKNYKVRRILCKENRARRQTLSLKKGMTIQIYGMCSKFKMKLKTGQECWSLGMYAIALQGWYIPTMVDIRKMPKKEFDKPQEFDETFVEDFGKVLDQFLTTTEHYDEKEGYYDE